jgi:hypothetical protein
MALLAALLFAFFGLLALVVDVGVASLAGARLESAADALALAGLRVDAGAVDPLSGAFAETAGQPVEGFALAAPTPLPASPGAPATLGYEQSVPLLFGHGSLVPFAAPGSLEAILAARRAGDATPRLAEGGLRERGIALRAARAERLAPVVRVGVVARAGDGAPVPGRADFAVRAACWPRLPEATPEGVIPIARFALGPEGVLALLAAEPPDAALAPDCIEEAGSLLAPAAGSAWVGDALGFELVRSAQPRGLDDALVYVPLLDRAGVVLGFAPARASLEDGRLVVSRTGGLVAQGNASAVLPPGNPERLARAREALARRAGDPGWLRAPTLAGADRS